MNMQWE